MKTQIISRSGAFVGLSLLLVQLTAVGQPNNTDGLTYKTGFSSSISLGIDLYGALRPEFQRSVHVQPVSMEMDVMPYLRSVEEKYADYPKPMRMAFISVGFVDLINYVGHAQAIDEIQKGYFKDYVVRLSNESGERELAELPGLSNPQYWTDDVLNRQLSNFNQMVGILIAIELSHHYLGHFKKYRSQLTDANGKPIPINRLLTDDEWEKSVKYGTWNALNCGLGIDGVKALYQVIDEMPRRPAWTEYFLPPDTKVKKVYRQLKKLESDFFSGKKLKE